MKVLGIILSILCFLTLSVEHLGPTTPPPQFSNPNSRPHSFQARLTPLQPCSVAQRQSQDWINEEDRRRMTVRSYVAIHCHKTAQYIQFRLVKGAGHFLLI